MTEKRFIDHEFIARIEGVLRVKGITPTAFGRVVANDSMLLADLRDGRELRRDMRLKIEQFITENLPDSQDRAAS